MTKNGTTYYYHVNGHGDVVALTDGSGNTVAQYSYDAWGNIISQSGTMASENPLRYAGYRYDEATGLYYLMARYYDPNIGRFITRDTFHGFEEDPLSLNQYAYAQGNPVIYVDPSGHAAALAVPLAYAVVVAVLGAALVYYYIKTLNAVRDLVNQSFARVQTQPNYRSKYETHHIVAQTAPLAQPSRNILNNVDLNVNSPVNLVSIKTGLHKRLHSETYYNAVNKILGTAYNKEYSKSTNQKRVLAALDTIKIWLKIQSSLAPF